MGTVYQRKSDGRWCASIQINGKRKTLYGKTERDVKAKLAELHKHLATPDTIPTSGKKSVNDLLDIWLETAELRPLTRAGYEEVLDRHVRSTIDHIRLNRLRPDIIQKLYNDLRAKGHATSPPYPCTTAPGLQGMRPARVPR